MTTSGTSKFGEPTSHRICIIYNPADGRVVHTHEVLTYPNGRQITESDVEKEALALLSRRTGINVSGFGILHVRPAHYRRGARYRVELPARRLIYLYRDSTSGGGTSGGGTGGGGGGAGTSGGGGGSGTSGGGTSGSGSGGGGGSGRSGG
jgi:hypothetical protein